MSSPLIELHYLPSLAYFNFLLQYDEVFIEVQENFQKQSYRNRCHILSANKVLPLSIPVKKGSQRKKIKDVEIDHSQLWAKNHWRTITSSYGKSPFFEYYIEDFRYIFERDCKYLFDWNWSLLTLCLKLLRVSPKLTLTERYNHSHLEDKLDYRSVIHPKKDSRRHGFYQAYPYQQIFGKNFVQDLSIIDLLFCEGPNAMSILRQSLP